MFKRFIAYYKPYIYTFSFDMFCAMIISIIDISVPLIISFFVKQVFTMPNKDLIFEVVSKYCLLLLLLYFIRMLATFYVTSYGHIMGSKMEANMRSELFEHLEKLSFSYYDKNNTGTMMSRIVSDLFDVTELAHHGPEDIFISIIKLTGSFIILMSINLNITLILLAVVILMGFFSYKMNVRMKRIFFDNREKIGSVNAILQDSLSGIRVVKSFSNENIELEKFEAGNQKFLESKKASYLNMGYYHSVNGFFQGLLYLSVFFFSAYFIKNGNMEGSDVLTYVLYINMFLEPINKLINFTELFQKGMTGFLRMTEILDVHPDIVDSKDAKEVNILKGDIEFKDIQFKYDEDEAHVFKDINLKIQNGKTVAIVGPSGSGKTTFCSLIPRFYETHHGKITIDGIDIKNIKLKSLRHNIGIVQQDVYIFNSTIRENIAYGKPGATFEEIVEAAKKANIHDYIMTLEDNYDTMVGERGVRFSGGQKQRISIARVFLKNPPILILDEATSALDNESEAFIQKSLDELSKNRTTIVIAHRLSTIKNADEIMVLEDENIKERGTHEELMDMNGSYAHLYNLQFAVS